MEAKTLLRLIKDDVAHLEGITCDFLAESLPSPDEVELARVRASALLRELELLHKIATRQEISSNAVQLTKEPQYEFAGQYHSGQEPFELFDNDNVEDKQEPVLMPDHQYLNPVVATLQDEIIIEDQPNAEELHENTIREVIAEIQLSTIEEPAESVELAQMNPIDEEESSEAEPVESLNKTSEEPAENVEKETVEAENQDRNEEILAEEFKEEKKTLNEILGESHQMVNDILAPEIDETGYKISPINSIWDGIGINDRFLFIRELFANSSAKFENTVTALDKLTTIQDAVVYLKMNFKWNKTEASHKFLGLVKRRFTK